MSAQPPGGWWQASDGNWFPPEAHPGYRPPAPKRRSGRLRKTAVIGGAVFVALLVIGAIGNAVSPPKKQTLNLAAKSKAATSTTAAPLPTTTTTPATSTTAVTPPTTAAPTIPPPQPAAQEQPPTTPVTTAAAVVVTALPNRSLTPGVADPRVTQENIGSTICVAGYSTSVRPSTSLTDPIKTATMVAYGRPGPAGDYELDHLISLELGGAPADVRNLWPEPYERSGRIPKAQGSETKDSLENRLHDAVCAGRVSLAAAQQAEAADWLAAYRSGLGNVPVTTTARPTTTTKPVTTTAAPAPGTTAAPTTAVPSAAPAGQGEVHPGAYCSPDGATGHTSAGTPMVCKTTATDSRDRWRAA